MKKKKNDEKNEESLKDHNLISYEDTVKFLATTNFGKVNYFGGIETLTKGKYDINYAINLLKIILNKCQGFPERDFKFSMQHSLKRLLAYLEVERDQNVVD
jgi:hypothetical protein